MVFMIVLHCGQPRTIPVGPILRENRKPVEIIIQEPIFKEFMQSISNVSLVVVFGHSCSQVDKPYFAEIAKNIKGDANWLFYVHNAENNKSVERYANKIKHEHQTLKITNFSPIKLVKSNCMSKKSTPIPGLSFSWKQALGITQAKQKIARKTGIPTSKAGLERKIGNAVLKTLFGKK